MSVSKIKAALPKADTGLNGLDEIAEAMRREPRKQRVVVMIVDCAETKYEHPALLDDDLEIPPGVTVSARVRRIEPLDGQDAAFARRLLMRAYERRTGRLQLPLDVDLSVLGETDRARYGAAGLLKHGSGVFTGRADPETGEKTGRAGEEEG